MAKNAVAPTFGSPPPSQPTVGPTKYSMVGLLGAEVIYNPSSNLRELTGPLGDVRVVATHSPRKDVD